MRNLLKQVDAAPHRWGLASCLARRLKPASAMRNLLKQVGGATVRFNALCIADADFDLESETVIVNQLVVSQLQVAAEETNMSTGAVRLVGFDDDDDIERLAELLVEQLHLANIRLDVVFHSRFLQMFGWQRMGSKFFAIFAMGTVAVSGR